MAGPLARLSWSLSRRTVVSLVVAFAVARSVGPGFGAPIIETVAGGGVGDGLAAVNQGLKLDGFAVDERGNVYIAEGYPGRVRRVDAVTGLITTVAGKGRPGVELPRGESYFCGDGGPATEACLDGPSAVALDRHGHLLIADQYNRRVRQVDLSTGIITTFAGNGSRGPCPDGPQVGDPRDACLLGTDALAVDAHDDVYIGSAGRVYRVAAATGEMSVVAGGGTAECSAGGPATLARISAGALVFDAVGNLLIADSGSEIICRVDAISRTTSVVADGHYGWSLALDGSDALYLANPYRRVVERVDPASGEASIVAGVPDEPYCRVGEDGGLAAETCIGDPRGIAFDPAGNLLFAADYRIRRVDTSTGRLTTVAGNGRVGLCGEGGPATGACLDFDAIAGIAVDARGNLYIADDSYDRVWRVDAQSKIIDTLLESGTPAFCPGEPPESLACRAAVVAVAVDRHGDVLAGVLNDEGGWVLRVDPETGVVTRVAGGGEDFESRRCGEGGPAIDACLARPIGLAVNAADDLFISDPYNARVYRIDAGTGTFMTFAGRDGSADYCGDGGSAAGACVGSSAGIAIGPDESLYIAQTRSGRVRRVDPATGIVTTVAGKGAAPDSLPRGADYFCGDGGPATDACLLAPQGVLVDPAGNLLIADTYNNRVRRVDARTGIISTVAGNGTPGFCGDGGPATEACLRAPVTLAMESSGALLIADQANNRVRRISCPDTDGDGLCDAYDLQDLPGLRLQKATIVRRRKSRRARIAFDARVVGGQPSAGAAFLERARQSGMSLALYAGEVAPTLTSRPFAQISVGPDSCRFRRKAVRCSHATGEVQMKLVARTGVLVVRGQVRRADVIALPAGPLHLVMDTNDEMAFAAAADRCGAGVGALRCQSTPTTRR